MCVFPPIFSQRQNIRISSSSGDGACESCLSCASTSNLRSWGFYGIDASLRLHDTNCPLYVTQPDAADPWCRTQRPGTQGGGCKRLRVEFPSRTCHSVDGEQGAGSCDNRVLEWRKRGRSDTTTCCDLRIRIWICESDRERGEDEEFREMELHIFGRGEFA